MKKTTYIYTLADPFTGLVRYVGKADDLRVRFNHHVSLKGKANTKKKCWVQSLLKKGVKPTMEVVEIVDSSEWKYWEQFYISLFRSWGFNLLNHTDGGEGLVGYKCSDSTKEKLRSANLGKKQSEETKARRGLYGNQWNVGKKRTEEVRKKFSQIQTGAKRPEAVKKKMSDQRKGENHHFYGKKLSQEHKNKIAESWKTRPHSFNPEASKAKLLRTLELKKQKGFQNA